MVVGAAGVGTSTDVQGRYSLAVARGARLSFSFVGYGKKEVAVGDQASINVVLETTAVTTQTAVVTGIFDKPRESYTGAATMLTGTQLKEAGGGNLAQAVRNLDPTFYIAENVLNGSDPNTLPVVTMRGGTTLPTSVDDMEQAHANMNEANLPLVILNNFEVKFSRLVDIDENMVESITLLKDASATSVYGTRGANGVIVITTKLPQPGHLQLSYLGRIDIEVADLSSYNLMDASEKLEYERLAGLYTGNTWENILRKNAEYNQRRIEVLRGVNTDWLHYPIRTGIGHSHTLRIEGGEESFRYSLNAGFRDKAGVMKGSSRKTFNGGMYFQYNVKKLIFRNDLQISSTAETQSPWGNFSHYAEMNPYFKPYDNDGVLQKIVDDTFYGVGLAGADDGTANVINPLWNANKPSRNTASNLELNNAFTAEWRIVPELKLKADMGVNFQRGRGDVFRSAEMSDFDDAYYTGDKAKYKGSYMLSNNQYLALDGRLTASYSKLFKDKHLLFVNLAGGLRQETTENYSNTSYGIVDADNASFGAGYYYRDDKRPYGYYGVTRKVDGIFSINYTYDSRYYVDLSGNYTGSSIFGENNRFAPIWSIGAGWNMHREHWFSAEKVNMARLRASYGITASENFKPGMNQVIFKDMNNTYDIWAGSYMAGIGNPDLKWQQTWSWNIGTDLAFFDNRLTFEGDFYRRMTRDLISSVGLPPASGFGNYTANIGEVENKGYSFRLAGTILQNKARRFSWSVALTGAHNANKIKKISEALKQMNADITKKYTEGDVKEDNYKQKTAPAFLYTEGQSLNTIYAIRSEGIDPMSGNEILLDRNGKRYFSDAWNDADVVPCGNTDPKMYGSFSTTLRYQGWRLTAYFGYSFGAKAYNDALANKVETVKPWLNTDKRALYDRWSKVGQIAKFKGIGNKSITRPTSRLVMNNNYFDFQRVQLAYDVDVEWSKRVLGMSYLSVTAETSDLFHFSTMKRERGTAYPFARTYSFTLTARF